MTASEHEIEHELQIEHGFIVILSFHFPPYWTDKICIYFLISYELFIKIAFLNINSHFAFVKVKTQGSLPLCQTVLLKIYYIESICQNHETIHPKITITGREA